MFKKIVGLFLYVVAALFLVYFIGVLVAWIQARYFPCEDCMYIAIVNPMWVLEWWQKIPGVLIFLASSLVSGYIGYCLRK